MLYDNPRTIVMAKDEATGQVRHLWAVADKGSLQLQFRVDTSEPLQLNFSDLRQGESLVALRKSTKAENALWFAGQS